MKVSHFRVYASRHRRSTDVNTLPVHQEVRSECYYVLVTSTLCAEKPHTSHKGRVPLSVPVMRPPKERRKEHDATKKSEEKQEVEVKKDKMSAVNVSNDLLDDSSKVQEDKSETATTPQSPHSTSPASSQVSSMHSSSRSHAEEPVCLCRRIP